MTNTLQVDTKGLDQLGESTLTFSELKRHMDNTKTVALLDAAFTDIVAASPRLEIRRDGTYIALPERKLPLHKTCSATIALIDAMTASAMTPGEESEAILELAEMRLGESRSRCVRSAIQKACTSEAMEFQVRIGERSMTFRLPHKSTMTPPTKSGSRPHPNDRSEEHTSELQSLMRISYAVFCLTKKTHTPNI